MSSVRHATGAVAAAPPAGYQITQDLRIGSRRVVRARSALPGVEGERAYLHVGSGLSVSASDVRHTTPAAETISVGGVLKVHVRLAGASRVGVGVRDSLPVGGATCSALVHPAGELKVEHFGADVAERSVTVACRPDWLADGLGLGDTALPAPITRFLEGREDGWYSVDAPLHVQAHRAAQAILTDLAVPVPATLLVEARALEILGYFFGQWEGEAPATPLRTRDRRLADNAKAILDGALAAPPALSALARDVGTHQAKLMRVFKAAHGKTISAYVEAQRMERARALLQAGELSITEVAYEAGYQHPANFTTAFKRYYGSPPSAVRRAR